MRLAMWVMLGLCGSTTAFAGEKLDLVRQHRDYGFQGVSMIVGAYDKSDQSGSAIRHALAKGGLAKLKMSLDVSPELANEVIKHGELSGCTWSWGVYCQVDVEWKTRPPERWGAQCLRGKEVLKDVELKSVVVPLDKNGKGPVQIDGVQLCWSAGGDSVRLWLRPPLTE